MEIGVVVDSTFCKAVTQVELAWGKFQNLSFHQLNPYKCDKVAKQI